MAINLTKIKDTAVLGELAAGDHLLVESGGVAKRIPASALKQPGLVFDTVADMETYIAANADKLAVGMDLFIREEDAPDYWWDGEKAVEVETDLSVVKADIAGLKTGVETNSKDIGKISEEITDKLDADKLPEAINTALEQAKASGEFDGEPGEKGNTGDKGDKGDKGDPGYTPVKGTDYFTESDKTELVSAVLAALPAAEGVGF